VKITPIPSPPKSAYPKMAYVELIDNNLEPIPDLPVIKEGKMVVYGKRQSDDALLTEAVVAC